MVILGWGIKVKFVGVECGWLVFWDGVRLVLGMECWVLVISDDRKEEWCEGFWLILVGGKGVKCVWEVCCGCVGWGK